VITDHDEIKSGKRIHHCEYETASLAEDLNGLFEKTGNFENKTWK
jgi:hypothetical protein